MPDVEGCVFCGIMTNLNTVMKLPTVSGDKEVKICDEHAQNATIKSIRKAYESKDKDLKKLTRLMKEAEMLGYKLVPKNQKIEVAKIIPPIPGRQTARPVISLPAITSVSAPPGADASRPEERVSVSSRDGQQVISHTTEAQVLTSNTRGGITLPKKIVGNTGETNIHIVNTNDSIKMEKGEVDRSFARQSHVRECSPCRGTGMLREDTICPRCGGKGMVML
ncbi:MAG: hypothetical protein Q8K86_09045 [Candidatus Nanopelagicaceae bacterium]|nr:hypothetical protein [Candidatus Nanopelagicaceae bacterium]